MLTPLSFPATPAGAKAALIDALGECGGDLAAIRRDLALGVFRRHFARIQNTVRTRFEHGEIAGIGAARLLAELSEGLIQVIFGYSLARSGAVRDMPLALLATGGFGRGMLAPMSDLDLLFLTAEEPSDAMRQIVEFMLYLLWDLGLKVGHATRSIDDCLAVAKSDLSVRTALLDARLLEGDGALAETFLTRFRTDCIEGALSSFLAGKEAERAARHRRYGESPFLVEPNVKEGRGGLRDLQTIYWMAKAAFDVPDIAELGIAPDGEPHEEHILSLFEARRFQRSLDFLWAVRFHLHYVTGRAEERLTFDLQPVIGARMGYTRHLRQDGVERFMRHYFLTAREVTRLTRVLEPAILRAALGPPAVVVGTTDPALAAAGFLLDEGKLTPKEPASFARQPILMLRMLEIARGRNLDLHPLALAALIRHERNAISLRGDPEAAAIFLDLLCGRDAEHGRADGARWLTIMNESGILGRLLPDWARIVGQMQFDSYHVFTVDEHTVEAVRILDMLERDELAEIAPVASGLMEHLQSRRALYVATLLHDIAKGRGGDHSEIGARIALTVGPALGLSAEETEMVSWLVLHHLLLSQTAFKRDIDDPKTILDLADTIQSPERLRLLLILTVADMRAVSAKVWNAWKATLLRELYARVAEVLAGGLATTERDVRVARAKRATSALLGDWPADEVQKYLSLGYPGYWLAFDPNTHARHARMIRGADSRNAPLTVETQILPQRAVTEVTVYTADHPGLFSRIAGALAVAGASIVDARIHTMTNGMALDTFWIQDAAGGAFDAPHRLARLAVLIEQALSDRLKFATEIRKVTSALLGRRMRAIHVPARVVIDNRASNTHTVIEVNGRDRPGFLHDVTAAISEQGISISSAHVSTYGVRAVDVFYVKDMFGLKITSEPKLAQLRQALLAAIAPAEEPAIDAVPPARRRRRA
ncbi:MAG TPA: [protein-PII] uridylyltransferase [Acetobacteraceae bacterium]|jgi:[protein-PII] uridylyltransferase|nr:[protein-PII] uridylyltransferase [Acetobacteraceae bacterium]